MANNVIPRFSAKLKGAIRKGYHRVVFRLSSKPKTQEGLVICDTNPPLPYPTQYKEGVSFFEIGVGVYQGEFVVIRQSLIDNKPSYLWVVHKLSPMEFRYISSQIPKLLIRLAHSLECGRQLCTHMNNIKVFNCKRCGHQWPSEQERPRICPKCKSAYWDIERRHK